MKKLLLIILLGFVSVIASTAYAAKNISFQDSVQRLVVENKQVTVYFRLHAAKYQLADASKLNEQALFLLWQSNAQSKEITVTVDPVELTISGITDIAVNEKASD